MSWRSLSDPALKGGLNVGSLFGSSTYGKRFPDSDGRDGMLTALSLPPGDYELGNFLVMRGKYRFAARPAFKRRFRVTADAVTYAGNLDVYLGMNKNERAMALVTAVLGESNAATVGAAPWLRNAAERDLPLIRKMIPSADQLVIRTEVLEEPEDQEHAQDVIRLAAGSGAANTRALGFLLADGWVESEGRQLRAQPDPARALPLLETAASAGYADAALRALALLPPDAALAQRIALAERAARRYSPEGIAQLRDLLQQQGSAEAKQQAEAWSARRGRLLALDDRKAPSGRDDARQALRTYATLRDDPVRAIAFNEAGAFGISAPRSGGSGTTNDALERCEQDAVARKLAGACRAFAEGEKVVWRACEGLGFEQAAAAFPDLALPDVEQGSAALSGDAQKQFDVWRNLAYPRAFVMDEAGKAYPVVGRCDAKERALAACQAVSSQCRVHAIDDRLIAN